MSHEIAHVGGTANAIYVGRPAWHNLGKVFEFPPTRQVAIEEAGLDYEVQVVPSYIRKTTESGDEYYVEAKTCRHTVRTDTGTELGSVGTRYEVLQNEEAFRSFDPLLDNGIASIEAAFALRGGADAIVVVKFDLAQFGPVAQKVLGGEVDAYGLIANNHDGRRGVLLQVLPFRIECANMLALAESRIGNDAKLGRAVVLKHTASIQENVVTAAEQIFHGLYDRYEVVGRQYHLLKQRVLEEQEFKAAVLDVIAPDPRERSNFNPEAKLANLVVARADAKRDELRRLWEEGAGHTGDHSAWEAYNAATQALDHNTTLWPGRNGAYRTASLLDGTYAQLKDQVLNRLLEASV